MNVPYITIAVVLVSLLMKFSKVFVKKEYTVTSELDVDPQLFATMDLRPGDEVFLENTPASLRVLVKVKDSKGELQTLGTINNKELANKLSEGKAQAQILYAVNYTVKLELSYS